MVCELEDRELLSSPLSLGKLCFVFKLCVYMMCVYDVLYANLSCYMYR